MAERWCYVAQKDGRPGAAAIVVDAPGEERHTSRAVAAYISFGYTVERVPLADGVARFREFDAWRRANARQGSLPL